MTATTEGNVLERTIQCLNTRHAFLGALLTRPDKDKAELAARLRAQRLTEIRQAASQLRMFEKDALFPLEIGKACEWVWSLFHPALSPENRHTFRVIRMHESKSLLVDKTFLFLFLDLLHLGRSAIAWGGQLNVLTILHYRQAFIELKAHSTEESAIEHDLNRLRDHLALLNGAPGQGVHAMHCRPAEQTRTGIVRSVRIYHRRG